MLILAIEQSTRQGSIALLKNDTVLAEDAWMDPRFHSRQLFTVCPALVGRLGRTLGEVDTYVVGLGPGSFTGLRMALAAAAGFAMPGNCPLFGVSSAEAIAADLYAQHVQPPVLIVGDARRDQLWMGRFGLSDGLPVLEGGWRLGTASEIPGILSAGGTVASPENDRLDAALRAVCGNDMALHLIEGNCLPCAARLGRLAKGKIDRGWTSDPLTPVYLHPPVMQPGGIQNR